MKKILNIFLLLLCSTFARAQGRYAGASMELGVGARPLALGSAAAALNSTGETFFYNPSSLGLLTKPHINFMHAPTFGKFLQPMANYNYFGATLPMRGGGVIAFNWTRFAVDDIPIYPELKGASFAERNKDLTLRPDGIALGYFEDVEDVFYFSFAKTLESIMPLGWWYGDLPMTIPFGINFKLLRQKLGDASASGMGVDAGMMIKFNLGTLLNQRRLGDLSFGLSFLDMTKTAIIWNTKHEDFVKQTFMFGISYSQALWFSNAFLNFYYTYHKKYERQNLIGIEFAVSGIALRLGKNENGFTAGAGLNWRRFFADYAFVNNAFEDVHRISCSIRL